MGKSAISMAIFNSYFDITRGYPSKIDLETMNKLLMAHRAPHQLLIVGTLVVNSDGSQLTGA